MLFPAAWLPLYVCTIKHSHSYTNTHSSIYGMDDVCSSHLHTCGAIDDAHVFQCYFQYVLSTYHKYQRFDIILASHRIACKWKCECECGCMCEYEWAHILAWMVFTHILEFSWSSTFDRWSCVYQLNFCFCFT